MKNRLALSVGCNSPNTPYKLHGCYNDVQTMQTLLTNHFGFAKEDIKIMIDKPNWPDKPTGYNIMMALVRMIYEAKKGDTLFFFRGSGTLVESPQNGNSPTMNFVFRLLVDYLSNGATFTFLADSSHSGGLILDAKEQKILRAREPGKDWEEKYRPKTFPIDVISTIQFFNIGSSDISAHLSNVFGTQLMRGSNLCHLIGDRASLLGNQLDPPMDAPKNSIGADVFAFKTSYISRLPSLPQQKSRGKVS
ncbi:metacaspase-9-like [Magnolia sinica]|uniref:metacaspase-9-like n=1 Tax=Magnolia sinica TaxID=86752 RepID=UPI00265AF64C|nr:metacaspase-9-like [Magnolia sinica]